MIELEQSLTKRLKELRVRVDAPDGDTLFLRNVPANEERFNKSRTNLLIKRPHAGQPFIVCVDEDLEYTGTDSALIHAFTAAHRQQGWRVIYLAGGSSADCQQVIENALGVVGFDGNEPVMEPVVATTAPGADEARLLASFATDISDLAGDGAVEPTVGRDEKIDEVVTSLSQWKPRLAVILGASGVGKTNLLYAVARKLSQRESPLRLLAVDLGVLMAGTLFDSERENLLAGVLKEALLAEPPVVLALEHLELAVVGVPRGQWLLAQALDQGLKMIGTLLNASLLELTPLARRMQLVELSEPWPEEIDVVLLSHRDQIAQHHQVRIDDAIVRAANENARWLSGAMPATAITLLDIAAAKAAGAGKHEVTVSDIYLSCSMFPQEMGAEEPRA
ncbi:MAG: ATP-dependent Clp protease ATP-binding subunit ClpB [Blastocatellia bacterium]|jgi:ATP-dependent Clp protease ATP-binding subunit ClpA|nr:ATP-dependent Clp protease ATP-binding subunit ClpB [Blastocatellia bacterium]